MIKVVIPSSGEYAPTIFEGNEVAVGELIREFNRHNLVSGVDFILYRGDVKLTVAEENKLVELPDSNGKVIAISFYQYEISELSKFIMDEMQEPIPDFGRIQQLAKKGEEYATMLVELTELEVE